MADVPALEAAMLGPSLVFLGLVLLRTVRRPRAVLSWILGFFAGFDTLQVHHVHLFSLASVLLALADLRRNRVNAWTPAVTVSAAACLATSVLYGSLVNDASLAVQLLLLALSATLVMLFLEPADLPHVLRGLLTAAALASVYAGLQTLHVLAPDYFLDSSGIPRVHAYFREPDFLSAFVAIGLVLVLRLPLRRALQVPLAALLLITLVVSQARGAWLAALLSLVAAAGRRRLTRRADRPRNNPRTAAYACAGGLATGGWLAADAGLRADVSRRLVALLGRGVQDPSLQARSGQFKTLLDLVHSAPWNGYGLSAAGRVTGLGQIQYGTSGNNVASNWVLDWMVGGKLLAIPLIIVFVMTALRGAALIPGQLAVLVLVNSLYTNLMLLPVAWLMLALTAVALSERPSGSKAGQSPQHGPFINPARPPIDAQGSKGRWRAESVTGG